MDLYTFGKTKACIRLVEILNERDSAREKKKVTNLLINFNETLKSLTQINDRCKFRLVKLLRNDMILRCANFPIEYKTILNNIVIYYFRQWFRENKGLTPKKIRRKND